MSDTPRTDSVASFGCVRDDFTRQLERELAAMTIEMREAFRLLNVLCLNMMDNGPTWPRVLEWLERNQQFKP